MNVGISATDLHAISATMLDWIGQALVLGTAVAALTWVLLLLLRGRRSPSLEIALWSIVLLKFLIPIGPGWSFSLASMWDRVSSPGIGQAVDAEGRETGRVADAPTAATAADRTRLLGAPPVAYWTTILAAVYLLGVIGLGVSRARSYLAFRRRCLAFPDADQPTRALVREVCRRLGVRRAPLIRISPKPQAAFVMGFVRPLLVLSRDYLVRPDEVETVVVHEVTHLRRGDLLVRCLQCVAGVVLFFWPVVAWVNRRIDRAREHACDECALRHGRLTAIEYAWCLLSAVRPVPSHHLTYQPACMAGNPSTIERRIDVILTLPSRPARRPVRGLLTVAILLAWGGFTLTGAAQVNDDAKLKKHQYLPTEQSMRQHAEQVYARVNEYAGGDQDGDGKVTKEECWVFVTAVAMLEPEATLEKYPEADRDQDGKLALMETYELVRGDYDVAKVEKKTQQAMQAALDAGDQDLAQRIKEESAGESYMVWHVILDRRAKFLDEMSDQPSAEMVAAIAAKVAKLEAKKYAGKISKAIEEVFMLEQKAAELREKATELGTDEAVGYQKKAEHLEQKAAELRAKITSTLEEQIDKLEAAGEQKKADELKAQLAKLEE